ncbi:histidine decarboxylase, pyruvoyl type [Labrenzia sp. CP4]|uniref:histidine decarboxylase, pyruvoyl type n=1 Tax=Labrenzia sp. CP4 TaxID=1674922 RepID=UPI0011A42564|nr:histidine decarboxylase, pyruvoyl type [Labrenzia sp. CP4]
MVDCDKDLSVPYDRTFMAYADVIMKSGFVGTALTVAPYIKFAQPDGPASGFNTI